MHLALTEVVFSDPHSKCCRSELRRTQAPTVVQHWAATFPEWVSVEDGPQRSDLALDQLDRGERAALELAFARKATILLVDERKARMVARSLDFKPVGTLAILRDSHRQGWIDGRAKYEELIARTNFFCDAATEHIFLKSIESL